MVCLVGFGVLPMRVGGGGFRICSVSSIIRGMGPGKGRGKGGSGEKGRRSALPALISVFLPS